MILMRNKIDEISAPIAQAFSRDELKNLMGLTAAVALTLASWVGLGMFLAMGFLFVG